MRAVRIADKDADGFLAVDLSDILGVLGKRGEPLRWFAEHVELVGDITSVWPRGALDLEAHVDSAPEGLQFAWQQLCKLAAATDQTINCRISARAVDSDAIVVQIEAFDSAYWTVAAMDAAFLDEVQQAFRETSDVLGL